MEREEQRKKKKKKGQIQRKIDSELRDGKIKMWSIQQVEFRAKEKKKRERENINVHIHLQSIFTVTCQSKCFGNLA